MSPGNRRILYVDDDEPNRRVFEMNFGDDFPLLVCSRPSEALALVAEGGIAVVISDQRMPEMTGNDLLIRVRDIDPDIIRVILTAYSDLQPILDAVNRGIVVRYIVKPWDPDDVRHVLAWALEAYAIGNANSEIRLRIQELERLAVLGAIGLSGFHDIRQALAGVMSHFVELDGMQVALPLMRRSLATEGLGQEPVVERLAMRELVNTLPEIVRDMRDALSHVTAIAETSRLLSARKPPTPDLEPHTTVRRAIKMCKQHGLELANADIAYFGPEVLPAVPMESTDLMRVLINLITNATAALALPKRQGSTVRVEAAVGAGRLVIRVIDNGRGIDPATKDRIERGHYAMRQGGLGVGVAHCKQLTEHYGGTVAFESELGVGTTVAITLPVLGEPAPRTVASL